MWEKHYWFRCLENYDSQSAQYNYLHAITIEVAIEN